MSFALRSPALILALLVAAGGAHASGTTPFPDQNRVGLMLNVPIDGGGLRFNDTTLSLVYQDARVKTGGSLNGWQVAIGTRLTQFTPMFSVSGISGNRCTYGSLGVSYGDGKWGLPLFLHGAYAQLGLSNAGGFGGFQAGVSSLGCFKRYEPTAPAVVEPPPSMET